jgi:hypothetical protein
MMMTIHDDWGERGAKQLAWRRSRCLKQATFPQPHQLAKGAYCPFQPHLPSQVELEKFHNSFYRSVAYYWEWMAIMSLTSS